MELDHLKKASQIDARSERNERERGPDAKPSDQDTVPDALSDIGNAFAVAGAAVQRAWQGVRASWAGLRDAVRRHWRRIWDDVLPARLRHQVRGQWRRVSSIWAPYLPARREPKQSPLMLRGIAGVLSPLANGLLIVGGPAILLLVAFSTSFNERYSIEQTLRPPPDHSLTFLTASGEPFAHRGVKVEEPVKLNEVPKHFIDALLSMEDRRFYSHFGIDPFGVSRAIMRNMDAGGVVQGASTITQQLAKISYLSSQRTYERKIEEALIATWIELRLSKNEILERYLSSVYFGEGCYGLRAAARHYFGKNVQDLTLGESAMLVAYIKAPTKLAAKQRLAHDRTKLVLRSMVETGVLTQARADQVELVEARRERIDPFGAYYADWLSETLEMEGPAEHRTIPVQTAFNPNLQKAAESAVAAVMDKEGARRGASEAAVIIMRPDGRVLAMVGGRDYAGSQFNRATQALRQPGSSFKLFVYLAALRNGATLDMSVPDEPFKIGNYEPKNFDNAFRGIVTLDRAFASSINTVAVRLSDSMGHDQVIQVARQLGISTDLQPTPSIALGAYDVTLLDLTSAYAAVAAGAYPVKPWGVTGMEEVADGGKPPAGSGKWKLMEADRMRDLLQAVVRSGSGRAAQLPIPTYGKTGTSQEFRNAWFFGFAGNLVVGVWVGNDDNSPMKNVTGGSLPAQIWHKVMTEAMKVDPDFQKTLPQVEAYEASTPTYQKRRQDVFAALQRARPSEELGEQSPYESRDSFPPYASYDRRYRDREQPYNPYDRRDRYSDRRQERQEPPPQPPRPSLGPFGLFFGFGR